MGLQARKLNAARTPAECLWFSPEDACRHALAAYYLAEEATHPPAGEAFECPEGSLWSSRSEFAVNFLIALAKRLHEQGQQSGHPFAIQISSAGTL